MRKILFILPLFALLGLCGCRSTQSLEKETTVMRDSVRIRDSVNLKDSTVIKTSVRDSVRLRDSVVIHLDPSGNVVNKESYHERDHYHSQSDSLSEYKLMLKEALLERDKALQHQEKEKQVIVKGPTLGDKIVWTVYGIVGTIVILLFLYRKRFLSLFFRLY